MLVHNISRVCLQFGILVCRIYQGMYYWLQKNMENLIEPLQITEEILHKIGYDFIRRYELKQEINISQLKDDTNYLIEQLRLYNRIIKQLKLLSPTQSAAFDEKFNEVVFKILNCLSRIIYKLTNKYQKLEIIPKFQQTVCDICGSNLNSKKIANLNRQIFDSFPTLHRQQILQKERSQIHHYFSDEGSMNEQDIRKKMLTLQRNLQERQSGLLRSIQQFQSFRNDLIIGLPKLNSKEGFEKFDVREYAFQMGNHFHTNIKKVENKISMLKTVIKKTQQQSVQCFLGDNKQSQKNISQIDNFKMEATRAQSQVKKLLQIKARLQQGLKNYQTQLKSLKLQFDELEQKNIQLKEQNFLQKLKKIPKERHNKPIMLNRDDKQKRNTGSLIPTENITTAASLTDEQVFNQISSHIAEMKSQIESTGTRMQDVFPIIKNTVKKALGRIINERMSSTMPSFDRRKQNLETQQDSGVSAPKKKMHGSSFKGVSNFYQKKEIKRQSLCKQQQAALLSISTQFNYKIIGNLRSSINGISILDQKLFQGIHKKSGISSYKKSLLHTEGILIPRKLITKMSSLPSQHRQNFSNSQQSMNLKHQKSGEADSYSKQNEIARIQIEQNSVKNILVSRNSQLSLLKKNRKNISCEDLTRRQGRFSLQEANNLTNIIEINTKSIPANFISSFLQPKLRQQKQSELLLNSMYQRNQLVEVERFEKKQIKRQLKLINRQKKCKLKSIIILKLDQISYLTIFFTLMARAHVENLFLYTQLKNQIFAVFKNKSSPSQNQEAMLRQLVGEIIFLHRKCEESKDKKLCKHLSQFLQAFQFSLKYNDNE